MIPNLMTLENLKKRLAELQSQVIATGQSSVQSAHDAPAKRKPVGAEKGTIEWVMEGFGWNHVQDATWKKLVGERDAEGKITVSGYLQMISPENMRTVPDAERAGFRKQVMEEIETFAKTDPAINVRWILGGLGDKFREPQYPLPYGAFERIMSLNGQGPKETVVVLITPDEADAIEKESEEYFRDMNAAKDEKRPFEKRWLPVVYEVLASKDDMPKEGAEKYVRDGRFYIKVCLDTELTKGYHRTVQFLNKILVFNCEDTERSQKAYGYFLGHYGVRRGVVTSMIGLAGGDTGSRQAFINERYPVQIGNVRYEGGFALRALNAEGATQLGYEKPEGHGIIQVAVHITSPMFKPLSRRYADASYYPESRSFRKGDVLQVTGVWPLDGANPFFGIKDVRTGAVDDVLYGILHYVCEGERRRKEREQDGEKTGEKTTGSSVSSKTFGKTPEEEAERWKEEKRKEEERRVDRNKKSGRPSGKKERGGGKNFRDMIPK